MSDSGYETSSDNKSIEFLIIPENNANANILNEQAMQEYPNNYIICCNQALNACGNFILDLLSIFCH